LVDGELRNVNIRKIPNTSMSVIYKHDSIKPVIFYNVPIYRYGPNTYIKLNQDLFNDYVDQAKYLDENEDGIEDEIHSPVNDEDKAKLK
jgi:hypothetical protein